MNNIRSVRSSHHIPEIIHIEDNDSSVDGEYDRRGFPAISISFWAPEPMKIATNAMRPNANTTFIGPSFSPRDCR
jgi:hypothetical protein